MEQWYYNSYVKDSGSNHNNSLWAEGQLIYTTLFWSNSTARISDEVALDQNWSIYWTTNAFEVSIQILMTGRGIMFLYLTSLFGYV